MHKEQRSQWKRDAIDLSVDPSGHAGEDLPTPLTESSIKLFAEQMDLFRSRLDIICKSFDFQSAIRIFPN